VSADELELSVVLVNYNGAACLPRSLSALADHTSTEDVECIVVDSGSTDDSWRDVSTHWARARMLRFTDNIGFCAGCNRGAEAAAGRLLAFINYDGEVEAGWDAPLRELLADPTVAVATGLVLDPDGQTIQAAGLDIAPNMAAYGRSDRRPRAAVAGPADVPAASGALMMVRRADFLALGGFPERFFMYGEEVDYSLRAGGRIVFTPASAIRHEYGHTAGPRGSPFRLYLSSRNRLVNAARHLPGPGLAKAVLSSAASDLATLAQAPSGAAARAVARGWRAGLAGMRGERSARAPSERGEAASRLVTFREAFAEHRRIARG
jgi:GT2 family glycosyltransferase